MLERLRTEQQAGPEAFGRASHHEFSVADVLAFIRSYWPLVGAFAFIGLVLAAAYVVTAKRTYVATSQLLIETNQQATPTLSNTETLMVMDTPQIESQIALLMSDQIAGKVAQMLLKREAAEQGKPDTGAPGSANPAPPAAESYFTRFYQFLFGAPKQETVDDKLARVHAAMLNIQGNMLVQRVGLSYVLNLSFRSHDPKTAAFVANAIGDAYVQDKLDLRAQAARQGGAWLESRIAELRQSMNDAALDVQLFKAKRDYRLVEKPLNDQFLNSDGDLRGLAAPVPGDSSAASPPPRDTAKGKSGDVEPKQTTLEELESRAETYKKIYESYLQAYMETVQRQSYPVTNARVITRADPPLSKNTPKTTMSLAAGLVLGAMMGVGLALAHASVDRVARSGGQIARNLHIPLLGQVVRSHVLHGVPYAHLLPHPIQGITRRQPYWSFFIAETRQPPKSARELSAAAVALKQAMDQQSTRVVGFLGTTADLNSAAAASNLALLNTHAGWRTLLIEADTASPNLSSVFGAADSQFFLQDFLEGRATFTDVVRQAPQNRGLSLILARADKVIWTPEHLVALRSFIENAESQFDLILVHLPSVRSTNRAVTCVDSVVIVSKCGRTPMNQLRDIIADLRLAGKQPLGVIDADLA